MGLTRDAILEANDLKTEIVSVPEWGGDVSVRSMTGQERDAFEQALVSERGPDASQNLSNIRARLVTLSAVDDNGNRLFTDADIVPLGRKSAAALDRVFTVAQRLNGIGAKDVEDLAKN